MNSFLIKIDTDPKGGYKASVVNHYEEEGGFTIRSSGATLNEFLFDVMLATEEYMEK